jgi:hypothetical protein
MREAYVAEGMPYNSSEKVFDSGQARRTDCLAWPISHGFPGGF